GGLAVVDERSAHITRASGGDVEHLDGCAAGEVEPGQGDSPDRLITLGPEIDLAGAEVIDDTPPREVRLRHRSKDLEPAGDRIRVRLARQHGGAHEPIERRDGRGYLYLAPGPLEGGNRGGVGRVGQC